MAIAGIDQGASFVATCLAAALSCLLMGLYANWPVGLAPGMGLNALFAYTIVGDMGYPWQTALGAVFIAGVLFVIISTTRIRAWIIMSIPDDLKIGMTAGVGLFIGIIGLQNGGIIADHPATLVTMGDFSQIPTALAALSFLLVAILSARLAAGGLILASSLSLYSASYWVRLPIRALSLRHLRLHRWLVKSISWRRSMSRSSALSFRF